MDRFWVGFRLDLGGLGVDLDAFRLDLSSLGIDLDALRLDLGRLGVDLSGFSSFKTVLELIWTVFGLILGSILGPKLAFLLTCQQNMQHPCFQPNFSYHASICLSSVISINVQKNVGFF